MGHSKRRQECIERGLCLECQRVPAAPDRRRCVECLAYVAMMERARKARIKAADPKKRKVAKQRVRKLLETGQISYVTVSGYRPARKPRKNPLAVGGRVRGLRLGDGG